MATDNSKKKGMAFDVDIGTGHQKGNPHDEKIRQHLEQEAQEVRPIINLLQCSLFNSLTCPDLDVSTRNTTPPA